MERLNNDQFKSHYVRFHAFISLFLGVLSFGCSPRILSAEVCSPTHSPFGAGSGTAADPYQICSVSHLSNIQNNLSANYILEADLDMTNFSYPTFIPLASTANPFVGIFNGNNYTISNWTASSTAASTLSLFGALDDNAVVENLTLSNFAISAGSNAAILANSASTSASITHVTASGSVIALGGSNGNVGNLAGLVVTLNDNSQINHSSFMGSIIDTLDSSCSNIGGLVAYLSSNNTITNSIVTATINTPHCTYVGGLLGQTNSASSSSAPAITQSSAVVVLTGNYYLGGLVGSWSQGTISNSTSDGSLQGSTLTGGLVGYAGTYSTSSSAIIIHSSSSATVSSSSIAQTLGGLVGFNDTSGNVYASYATGNLSTSSPSAQSIGGFVGLNYGNISDGFATGSADTGSGTWVGGFVGLNEGAIDRVYALGQVSGAAQVGGVCGLNTGTISNSFWNETTSGTNSDYSSGGALGYPTVPGALFVESTYVVGWDFTNTWYPPTATTYATLR